MDVEAGGKPARSRHSLCSRKLLHPDPGAEILPWTIFAALALLAIYFVGAEEGTTSLINCMYVHEFVHDGPHLLGFPFH